MAVVAVAVAAANFAAAAAIGVVVAIIVAVTVVVMVVVVAAGFYDGWCGRCCDCVVAVGILVLSCVCLHFLCCFYVMPTVHAVGADDY